MSNEELFKQALVEGVNNRIDKDIQIEEMAKVIFESSPLPGMWMSDSRIIAEALCEAGYRKQSEGEWDDNIIGFCNVCMNCGAIVERSAIKNNSGKLNFCPNCGAKMKGGVEE